VTQVIFAFVNHARIRSWNQPVLSHEGNYSLSCISISSISFGISSTSTLQTYAAVQATWVVCSW